MPAHPNYHNFLRDASQATAGQGLDTEPVAYMGEEAYRGMLRDMQGFITQPDMRHVPERRVGGIQVYLVWEHPDHYHMTFRRTTR